MDKQIQIIQQSPISKKQNYNLLESNNLAEELALALLGRFKEVETLKLRFMESGLTLKERLAEIVKFKTALLVPALRGSLGLDIDFDSLRGSYDVLGILNSIEQSLANLIRYEEQENVDFNHPKIIAGNLYLFELIVEVLQKEVKDANVIKNVIDSVAVQTAGIENELNKMFKNLSSQILQTMPNPLIAPYKNKNRDKQTILRKLEIDLELARTAFSRDLSNADLVEKIESLLKELQESIQ